MPSRRSSGRNRKEQHMTKKVRLLVILLCIGIVVCIGVMLWAILRKPGAAPIIPDYAPEETDKNAEPIPGNETKIDAPAGGGAIGIEYVSEVIIDLSDGMVYLQYVNPGKSTQNIVLRVEIQGEAVAQSGLIPPGNRLKQLPLAEGMAGKLQPGGYDAQFRILSYNPETGEKAMIDTLAEIRVTVRE